MRLFVAALAVVAVTGLQLEAASARQDRAQAVPPKASPAVTAKRLAGQVAGARTPAARRTAVLAVLRAVGIGVYSSAGRALVRGGERSRADFYLYDAEVRALAAALGRDERRSLDELAAAVARTGALPENRGALLGTALQTAAAASVRRPRAAGALVPLLVRELGRRARPAYDLSRGVPAGQRLDALQTFLVQAGMLVPGLRASARRSRSLLGATACPDVKPEQGRAQLGDQALSWWAMKEVKRRAGELSANLKKAFNVKKLLDNIYYGLHGSVLAYSLRVTRVHNDFQTHFGPGGHGARAGEPLRFGIKIEMLDDLGEENIRCLALAGVKLPKKGPVPGVPVRFGQVAGDLRKLGTVQPAFGALGAVVPTGADGVATLVFTPRTEVVPGVGRQIAEHGTVDAVAEWANAFGNKLGKVNQYLTPKFDVMGWDVEQHEQWVFDATIEGAQSTQFFHSSTFSPLRTCFANSTTQGHESLQLGSAAPTRVVFYSNLAGDALAIRPPNRPGELVPFPIPAQVERGAAYTTQSAPEPCGDGGGGPSTPPPSDCGTKPHTLVTALAYAAGTIELRDEHGESPSPFQHCAVAGRYVLRLAGTSASLSPEQVKDETQSVFRLPLTVTVPVDETTSFTSGEGTRFEMTTTTVDRSTTTLNATLVLTRITAP